MIILNIISFLFWNKLYKFTYSQVQMLVKYLILILFV